MHDDQSSRSWAAFFGVLATSAVAMSLVLAVGVGILLGYYAIGSGDSGSSQKTTLAQAAAPSASGSGTTGSAGQSTTPAALVSVGEGLMAPQGVTAKLWTSGLPDISDLTYDTKGRLWATATHDPLSKGPVPSPGDGVYLLEKGKAPVKVISTVKLPVGLAWHHEELFISNYGYIEVYSGFNGHTFAHHKILINHIGAGTSGWSDNPAVGPEGRIYVEDGAACDACTPHGYLEAETISFNPDGSDIKVFAKGIRGNGFSEFMPGTDVLFEAMNQQNVIAPAPDDQLGVITEGANWGFPTCYGQGGAVCNGIATAVASLPQHNGTDGMALVNGQLGAAYGTSAFISSVTGAAGSVLRVALTKSGSSYVASGGPQEFLKGLVGADGIILTPEGALIVGSYTTGKIYELKINQAVNPGASATIPIKVPATITGTAPAATTTTTTTTMSMTRGSTAPGASGPATSSAKIEASPTGELMYVQKNISLKAGGSTVEFVNKSPLGHDVVVEQNGKTLGETPVITNGSAKLKLKLKPGSYKFYCSVPGHRMAGMEGTITVQ
jgi:glucose/arabinose dehydrogenase/plastocyanin